MFLKTLKQQAIDDIILIGMSGIVWMFAWRRQQTSRAHGSNMRLLQVQPTGMCGAQAPT